MAITRVHGPDSGYIAFSTTLTVTLGTAPTNGNLLVAAVQTASGTAVRTVVSIVQTGVNWSTGGAGKQVSKSQTTGYNINSEIWVGIVGAGALAPALITISGTANAGLNADICEYSGLAVSSFLDKTATDTGDSHTPLTGTTAATTVANELWFGANCAYWSGVPQPNLDAPALNSFTLLAHYTAGGASGFASEELIVSSTGTAGSGCTVVDAGTVVYVGCIATFKEPTASTEQLNISTVGTHGGSSVTLHGETFVSGVSWGATPVGSLLALGTYPVTFGTLVNYVTAGSRNVVLASSGGTLSEVGTYTMYPNGTLSLAGSYLMGTNWFSISGFPPTVNGLTWGSLPTSGTLAVGTHSVCFTGSSVYVPPSPACVNTVIVDCIENRLVGTYTYVPPASILGQWQGCPYCGEIAGIHRVGDTGVPQSKYGKRQRTYDSDSMVCDFCKSRWRSSAPTLWEALGSDKHGEGLI